MLDILLKGDYFQTKPLADYRFYYFAINMQRKFLFIALKLWPQIFLLFKDLFGES